MIHLFAVAALLSAACGAEALPSTTAPIVTSMPATSTVADQLAAFEHIEVEVAGETWAVALADTPDLRARGLMGVTDLGAARGMLFAWTEDSTSGFTMRDTLIALDIAFFASDGSLVEVLSMVPCEAEPCPSYRTSGPYRWALEVPAGGFGGLDGLDLAVP